MSWLRNLLYLAVLTAILPGLLWRAIRRGHLSTGWRQKLWGPTPLPAAQHPRIWLHAVSVGEINLLAPLIAEMQRRQSLDFVISTTTATGMELAKKKYPHQTLIYLPFDFSGTVRRALQAVQPDLLVLVELELWPNLLETASRQGVPLAVVNGRLSESSARGYRRWYWLFGKSISKLDRVLVQSPEYAARFRELGVAADRIRVIGNLKFDNVDPQKAVPLATELRGKYQIEPGQFVLVGGSTQPDEDRFLVATYQQLKSRFPHLRLVLAPRHPQRVPQLLDLLRATGLPYCRRSDLRDAKPGDVVVVDVIGELMAWWSLANVAYVGGSQGHRGGQNMIEPAACGAVVCFGPETRNFRDVVELLRQADAASVVRNASELEQVICQAIENPRWAAGQGERAQQLVAQNRGTAAATAEQLLELLQLSQAARRERGQEKQGQRKHGQGKRGQAA